MGHGGPAVKAYSMDLRQRVLADCDAGMTVVEVAENYRVSEPWVFKLKRRRRETGQFAPKPHPGRTPTWPVHAERIRAQVERTPDATLVELRQKLDLKLSVPTLCRALQALRLTLKKKCCGPPSRNDPT